MRRKYYSARTGKNPAATAIDLVSAKALFMALYRRWDAAGYFQEHFGYSCIDGDSCGSLGGDISAAIFLGLRKEGLWSIYDNIDRYSEDDFFDIIEFLYDHVSKPLDGFYHSFGDCGMHYNSFDSTAGRSDYREGVNEVLESYKEGFELSELGEILEKEQKGLGPLLIASVPSDDSNVAKKVESAINKFRRSRAKITERRDAIRDLADVLEYLRPKLKLVLTNKDEGDLFNLANNFGIRHHNDSQKTEYDESIWLSWMFYFYLATIHASLRFINKAK